MPVGKPTYTGARPAKRAVPESWLQPTEPTAQPAPKPPSERPAPLTPAAAEAREAAERYAERENFRKARREARQ